MSELFCKRFADWIYKTIGEKIDNDFYSAISDRDIELVYILKRDPDWLAARFSELCKKVHQLKRRVLKDARYPGTGCE